MSYALEVAELDRLNKSAHRTKDVNSILPFSTHAFKELRHNYYKITGQIVRNICNTRLESISKNTIEGDDDPKIKALKKEVQFESSLDQEVERFFKDYLYGDSDDIIITHPYLFNFSKSPDKEIYEKISKFIADVLVGDNKSVQDLFLNTTSDNILDELVLAKLKINSNNINLLEYQTLFPSLGGLYCEDLLYLSRHKEYFLNSFSLLTRFYVFMYTCQTLVKFEEKSDFEKLTPLYFALDWESVGKRRNAKDGIYAFKRIKDSQKLLFVHLNTLAQLSLFEANKVDNQYKFLHYTELTKLFDIIQPEDQAEYLASLQDWIVHYQSNFEHRVTDKPIPQSIEEGINILFQSNSEGIAVDAAKKYGAYIDDLGGAEFIKVRGRSGATLNLTKEMLLLLTSVCIKDNRIPLNQLFLEFSKRGIELDRISKKIVVELLDSLNFIDKKSDSGDAQYVKPIL
ncbi:DNA phosphorothioation-dependent restriction protein DptG [Cohnella sp. GCM10027633]|uniref:DNA phosphorothioation-dependent restriction protein DptG n=1 Tax=unclassified Cohnella TaxID=2636738 RepID=UPI003643D5E9